MRSLPLEFAELMLTPAVPLRPFDNLAVTFALQQERNGLFFSDKDLDHISSNPGMPLPLHGLENCPSLKKPRRLLMPSGSPHVRINSPSVDRWDDASDQRNLLTQLAVSAHPSCLQKSIPPIFGTSSCPEVESFTPRLSQFRSREEHGSIILCCHTSISRTTGRCRRRHRTPESRRGFAAAA